jgi:integrase
MARPIHKLTAIQVTRAKRPGYYSDGGGLFLRVGPTGAKSWAFRFADAGKRHEMGLGPCHTISLVEARQKAQDARKLRLEHVNPIEARRSAQAQDKAPRVKAMTFRQCAEAFIEAHRAGWSGRRQATQWTNSLTNSAFPIMGELPVAVVELAHVLAAIEPMWSSKPETANRVRSRIESVLDWAAARGYRQGDNPARWRGHLDKLLPNKSKVKPVTAHVAMPYIELPAFIAMLRQRDTVHSRALEFLILTATRTNEALGARWDEIDLNARTWTVPAARMKSRRDHRVPLCDRAVAIIEQMAELRAGEYVFPGRAGRLGHDAIFRELARIGQDVNAHGFRSSFRDWAAERTAFPEIVAEMSLAHTVGDAVVRAYRRSDLFEQRRRLMDAWAAFCAEPAASGEVVTIRSIR